MKQLKPCPFCGEKPIIRKGDKDWFYITCLDHGRRVILHTCIQYAETENEAVDVWNTRAESKKAYWIKHEDGRVLECPACGSIYRNSGISEVKLKDKKVFDYEEPRFCLHCGARMKERHHGIHSDSRSDRAGAPDGSRDMDGLRRGHGRMGGGRKRRCVRI